MTESRPNRRRTAGRVPVVLYTVGAAAFLTGVVLLLVNYPLNSDALQTTAITAMMSAWAVLAAGALLDMLSRDRPRTPLD